MKNDESEVKIKEVWSADGWNLLVGILCIVPAVLTEIYAVESSACYYNMPAHNLPFVFLQGAVISFLCFMMMMIKDYFYRTKFNIYCCKSNAGMDVNYIGKKYCIEYADNEYVLFVDIKNHNNFRKWMLLDFAFLLSDQTKLHLLQHLAESFYNE